MSSPDSNFVRRVAESIDCPSPIEASHREDEISSSIERHRARLLKIDQDEARLAAQGCTFYEIKASILRESDNALVWTGEAACRLSQDRDVVVMTKRSMDGVLGRHNNLLQQLEKIRAQEDREKESLRLELEETRTEAHAHTLPPLTPEHRPDLAKFLDAMSGRCFDAQMLIEEDLLYHFRFSGKKVPLVGDLDDRMTKSEMLEALKERKAKSGGASSSCNPSKEKRKIPSEGKERRRSAAMNRGTLCLLRPLRSASLDFIRRLVPGQDFDLALVWTGEATNHLSQARDEVVRTKRSMDGVLGRHNDLLKQLEEMRAQEDREKESMRLQLEAARTDAHSSKALAQSLEVKVQRSEEENKTLQIEVEKLQEAAANSWQIGKEEFLQSKEFDSLCSGRASVFFEQGFNGCLAQFRANGYFEEEHPASFLDVEQTMADMPEESEEKSSGSEEAPPPTILMSLYFDHYLIREFMSLRQGDRSVAEYVRLFERGCHFVPSISLVDSKKLRQFTDGLRPDIRHDVNMADVTTYMATVNRAYRSERGRKDMREDYQRKRQIQPSVRDQSSHPPAKRPFQGPSKGPSQQGQQPHRPQGQQGASAPRPEVFPICKECDKQHSGPCMAGSRKCFHCKEPGHISRDCPRKRQATGHVFVMPGDPLF
ncbi:hypothetical protein F511_33539 [Dorcoceras hygrometricum]|uniref:CCHC-type domain-containing protein n=1 Tax=Dorcoceras hygrometricum TaxID=472368 RepID=A0A2Z7D553_9LAMI|nr:hypothetical protein F511_33539 [Dorcoceras hygrometricum]